MLTVTGLSPRAVQPRNESMKQQRFRLVMMSAILGTVFILEQSAKLRGGGASRCRSPGDQARCKAAGACTPAQLSPRGSPGPRPRPLHTHYGTRERRAARAPVPSVGTPPTNPARTLQSTATASGGMMSASSLLLGSSFLDSFWANAELNVTFTMVRPGAPCGRRRRRLGSRVTGSRLRVQPGRPSSGRDAAAEKRTARKQQRLRAAQFPASQLGHGAGRDPKGRGPRGGAWGGAGPGSLPVVPPPPHPASSVGIWPGFVEGAPG